MLEESLFLFGESLDGLEAAQELAVLDIEFGGLTLGLESEEVEGDVERLASLMRTSVEGQLSRDTILYNVGGQCQDAPSPTNLGGG